MKTDITALKVEMADHVEMLREIKSNVRRVVDPNRMDGTLDGGGYGDAVPVSRVKVLRAGRNLTKDEGKFFHAAKRRVTLLCTIRAAHRGRVHSPQFIRSPELIEELAREWRSFEATAPAENAPVEQKVEVGA